MALPSNREVAPPEGTGSSLPHREFLRRLALATAAGFAPQRGNGSAEASAGAPDKSVFPDGIKNVLVTSGHTHFYKASDIMLAANTPYLKHVDLLRQGYAIVDITPEETLVEFRGIDTLDPEAEASTFARFRVVAGRPGIEVLPT